MRKLSFVLFSSLCFCLAFAVVACDESADPALDEQPNEAALESRQDCPRGPGVSYVSRDVDVCAVIRFVCEPGQDAFSNDCGCGCIDPTAGPPLNNCNQVERAFGLESLEIQSCNSASECGQVLTGTSCGCTRNRVARLDADTARYYAIIERAGELGCDLGLISTCDCPPTDGFACEDNICTWNYSTGRPLLQACGGIAGTPCPAGQTCVDDPNDSCDPDCGGADCGGFCLEVNTPDPPGLCGGIAGFPCPDGYTCYDNKGDACSPICGGADCGGFCARPPSGGGSSSTQ